MRKMHFFSPRRKATLWALALPAALSALPSAAASAAENTGETQPAQTIIGARAINPTTIELLLADRERMEFDFYGDNVFRLFQDPESGPVRNPEARPEARILVDTPRRPLHGLQVEEAGDSVFIRTRRVRIGISKTSTLFSVADLQTGTVAAEAAAPVAFGKNKVTLTLKENPDEYFYGGGVQNGRFSHKGKAIAIENQNSWTDGGVASPAPFYWSTRGYGLLWHTFAKGKYDFGAAEAGLVKLSHETRYLDVFFLVGDGPAALLDAFYQLTGNPVLLPKFGFYEGHLNAYNRDYWKEDANGILFEDGKRYKESQQDNGGIKESLNGENGNYQFSARAVIDRYKSHDMPLGWLLPNDGYGAGYGQTGTLAGNVQNLRSLGLYARENGVEIGLWTQSDLHPKAGVDALLQRDIVREVRDGLARIVKTDVAWVGDGYSFGLNGVADVAHILPYYGNNARPFIISLDGWAGTQRYAGVWSGDQTGGEWEYIRFHIPTYIGSGLSGQPNITSDMDGIFGGKNPVVNIRDFQWKAFTPMQLNMDGWGSNEKYPHALGEPAASINRWYLKLKSELLPYTYTFAKEATKGLPLIRALLLAYPNPYTLGTATRYQYMYGPDFLVAPVYQNTRADEQGNDIRDGIYLPEGEWVDYFDGETYAGGCVINSFDAPIWKLPLFVRRGAILPMNNPNNNVSQIDPSLRIYELYPYGHSSIETYDDDGVTEAYKDGHGVTTLVESDADEKGNLVITIHPAEGDFEGFVREKATEFRINVTARPQKVSAQIGGRKVKLAEVPSLAEGRENVYCYDEAPDLNRFATPGSAFEQVVIAKNPQVRIRLAAADIATQPVEVRMEGYRFDAGNRSKASVGPLAVPRMEITAENTEAYTLTPTWDEVPHADFYEIEFNGMRYTTIKDTRLPFDGLEAETPYAFRLRAVNKEGCSDWAECTATTKSDPLEFAIRGIRAETTAADEEGFGSNRLFDFAETGDIWHTAYHVDALPFDILIDLCSYNQLDKLHYLPRADGGNGTLLKGSVSYGMDGTDWTEAGTFAWEKNAETKVFTFDERPTARYVKLSVTEGAGNYGSGRELYVFKVPGTESCLPGDINNDGKIDANDLTSYTNYAGLRQGDADYGGYIGNGDINRNGLIDAYDISVEATRLEDGIDDPGTEPAGGSITLDVPAQVYEAEAVIPVTVKGTDLHAVNAFSFALPYDPQDYEFVGVEPLASQAMENLTCDRLHTNGDKALYPTFVHIGDKEALEGTVDLCILKFKARRRIRFDLQPADGMLVDKGLHVHAF